jgi:hypothetical protein
MKIATAFLVAPLWCAVSLWDAPLSLLRKIKLCRKGMIP